MNSVPFATVAIAGHATPGGRYCDCTGEQCSMGNLTIAPSDQSESEQESDLNDTGSTASDVDAGTMLLLLLTVYFGLRT